MTILIVISMRIVILMNITIQFKYSTLRLDSQPKNKSDRRKKKTNHIRRFLHSTKAKGTQMTSIVLIAILAVGAYWVFTVHPEWIPSFSIGGEETGLVDVNKKLQFTWTAEYSGDPAITLGFVIYDETLAVRESLTTTAGGIQTTAQNYPSGTHLYVLYDNANNQIWHDIIVPQMNLHDSESNTYNDIALKFYKIGTYSADSLRMLGIDVADGDRIDSDGNATYTPTFIYTLANTGADNTGLMESYDPVYKCAWQTWVTGRISGDNASLVTVNGADYVFTVGLDTYFACRVSSQALSKWKVGLNYVAGYSGGDSCSWSFDLTGFTATSTAVLEITVYECADPLYAIAHAGNFGNNEVAIADHTVNMQDT